MQSANRRCCKPANAASKRGVVAALAVLETRSEPMTVEEALAELERRRLEAESAQRRQGELCLRVPQ